MCDGWLDDGLLDIDVRRTARQYVMIAEGLVMGFSASCWTTQLLFMGNFLCDRWLSNGLLDIDVQRTARQ